MTGTDARDVAGIHFEALAGDFLPSMGKPFLAFLYKSILALDIGFGLVYERDGRVIGAVMATENTKSFYKRLFLKRFQSLIPRVVLPLLRKPHLLKNMFETLLYSNRPSEKTYPVAELMTLCILKSFRHQGIGTELWRGLNGEFKQRGVNNYIVRVYDDNEIANKFYLAIGFEPGYSYMMYGRKWNLYEYKIDNDEKASRGRSVCPGSQ